MKKTLAGSIGGVLVFLGQSGVAQAIHVKCKGEMHGQPVACITTPRDGSTIKGPSVRVVLAADGIDIAAAGDAKAGAAHYHLFLDTDVPPAGEAIPQGPGITHLGGGEKRFEFAEIALGLHRLIVVLGDNGHMAVTRQKSDTAYFTVAAR